MQQPRVLVVDDDKRVLVSMQGLLETQSKKEPVMANKKSTPVVQQMVIVEKANGHSVDWEALLGALNGGRSLLEYGPDRTIFLQGQPADSVFYLRQGKVKLSVTSPQGRQAIVALLDVGAFLGEECLAGQDLRLETAITVTECTLVRIERSMMARMLHEQQDITELFGKYLLSRYVRFEQDLADQLLNNSEKRLARILLLLAHFGKESRTEIVLPNVDQESLAQMVGTTRARVSHFMNKFRKLGFIDYDTRGLSVHSGLLSVVLHD